ncbi:MAG TPA: AAA family ATPase [Thermoleophilia bacterium]|nr:AAA family ATPase [Thermoleophilia bacterium]
MMKRPVAQWLSDIEDMTTHQRVTQGQYIDQVGVERWIDIEVDTTDFEPGQIDAVRNAASSLAAAIPTLPAQAIRGWLRDAMTHKGPSLEVQEVDAAPGPDQPRFPTGVPSINSLCGGGYGMTVIAGAPKVGKSLVAMSAAIESAGDGWVVIYVNAELNSSEIAKRLVRYNGGAAPETLCQNMIIYNVDPGITPEKILEFAFRKIDLDHERLLIVLDSVNRLATLSQQGDEARRDSYWGALDRWSEWARMSARISGGIIAFIVVSELNAQDHVKGLNLEYAADLVVRIKDTDEENMVEIDVPLARSSRRGDLGRHRRDWQTGRFCWDG